MGAGRRVVHNKWVETWLNLVDFACEYGKLYAIGKGQAEVMKTWAGMLLVGTLIFGGSARADEKIDCANPADTADENLCADMDFQKADKELNEVWRKVKDWAAETDKNSDIDGKPDHVKIVMAAQHAWLAYRDAYCVEAGLPMHGGSGEGPLIGGCRAYVTEERVKSLKGLLPQ